MAASRLWAVILCSALVACSTSAPTATPGTTATVPPTSPPTPAVTEAITPSPSPSQTPAPTATLPPTPSPSLPPAPQEGLGWSAVDLPEFGNEDECCSIASGDAGFLIFGGNHVDGPVFLTSTNGTSWRVIDGLVWPGGLVRRITDWDGAFLAAGVGGSPDAPRLVVVQSPDGRTWRTLAELDLPASAKTQSQVVIRSTFATEEKITVVAEIWPDPCREGCDGPIAVRQYTSSDNGGSWRSNNLTAEAANHDPAVVLDGVSVRMSRYWDYIEIRSGDDWQTAWLPEPGQVAQPKQVRLTSYGFVAVGYVGENASDGGLVLNSTDGVNWTQSKGWPDLDAAAEIQDVAQFGSRLVAIGTAWLGTFRNYVLVSPPLN